MEITQNIDKENLTVLEKQTLQAIINGLYAEPGFSDMDVNDLVRPVGKSSRVLRGVLSSLIKKGYIYIDDSCSSGNYQLIYLTESYYHLHPSWKDDSPWFENPENKTYEQLYIDSLNK
jgi:hypothetical protein